MLEVGLAQQRDSSKKKLGDLSAGAAHSRFQRVLEEAGADVYLVTYEVTVTVSEAVEDPSTVYVPVPMPWQMKFTCPGADVIERIAAEVDFLGQVRSCW